MRQLSPAQSRQIIALVRATLESFTASAPDGPAPHQGVSAPVPDNRSVGTLQAAVVSLGQLGRDLTARMSQHQDQVRPLAPILRALQPSGSAEPVTEPPRTPPIVNPDSASIAVLAKSLAEAVARLQETLNSGMLIGGAQAHAADPPDAFRWVLEAAHTETLGLNQPQPIHGDAHRLVTLARALLDAFAGAAPTSSPTPKNTTGADVVRTWAEPAVRDPRGHLAAVLDHNPAAVRLLAPILRELGLTAANVQPVPSSPAADEEFATAIARILVLASVLQVEAEEVGVPVLNRQILAEFEAAGLPPFGLPVESPANIETFRWLLVAAQLYNSWRLAPRQPRPRCHRCARTLQRAHGILICPNCG